MPTPLSNILENSMLKRLGIGIAFVSGFSINLSTSLQNIMVCILIVASFFHPEFKRIFKKSLENSFIRGALIFYLIFVVGVIWSSAPTNDILSMLTRMILYLLCPLIYIFFSVKNNVKAFFIGFSTCVVLFFFLSMFSLFSGLDFFQQNIGIHTEWYGYKIDLFRGHTYQNFFAGLVSVSLIIFMIEGIIKNRTYKLWTIALLVIMFINIFFLCTGRTGQILFVLMLLILTFHYMRLKSGIIFATLLILVTIVTVYSSANIRSGITNAINDIKSYKAGNANTSLGLRLTFYKNSITLFSESPIIGHGTGSFSYEYEKLNDKVMRTVGNPHNDYFWFAVELGIVGIIFFIIFLSMSIYQSFNTSMPFRLMATILIVTYSISSITNSFFTDNITGQFFILSLCALFAGNEGKG